MRNPQKTSHGFSTSKALLLTAFVLGGTGFLPIPLPGSANAQPATLPSTAPSPDDSLRPASTQLLAKSVQAYSWTDGPTTIVQLVGGVELQTGDATLRAESAVLWLTKIPGENRTRVDCVLIGDNQNNALIATPEARRFGERLAADFIISGSIRFDVPERVAADQSDTPLYQTALALRPAATTRSTGPQASVDDPAVPTVSLTPPETSQPIAPVRLQAQSLQTIPTDDGTLAVLATGGVFLMQQTPTGDLLELRASRAVVFTTLERLDDLGAADPSRLENAITGVYLEGDVRATYTPGPDQPRDALGGREQRLEAERAFYDFQTDRAVLTRAVLHTSEPTQGQPITVRANVVRQLAQGEYEAQQAEISTSRLATPDYSLNASRVFIRSREGRDVFGGDNITARAFGIPFFYFPTVRAASTGQRLPLRGISVGQSRDFGTTVGTEWGLFETLGATPPESFDATYSVDYHSDRGLAGGIDADYAGDLLLWGNRPVNFGGDITGYLVNDHGTDDLGGRRLDIPQDELRGHISWRHLHYFPDGYAAQLRLGYVSDPTFLPQWDRGRFNDGLPHDLFFNLDRTRGNERLGVLTNYEVVDFYTTADAAQENVGVERLPEVTYGRFGEALGPFVLTSRNRVGALQFQSYGTDRLTELGYLDRGNTPTIDESFAGIPSYGYTGSPEQLVGRGDFRQELSLPMTAGPLSIVPFAVGRFTAYSESVDGEALGRALAGGGATVSTVFIRTDDRIYSRLLDLDRIRHVVEPGVTGFWSWSDATRDEVFIYDQNVDAYSDISAVSVFLKQRWQTKRGAPGRKRSVDVFALNLQANYFGNEPDEVTAPNALGIASAQDFRGLYFAGEPEASLSRDGVNSDALWRVTDSTALVGEAAWNAEDNTLATLAAGVVIDRSDRARYSIGGRYVEPLDLTLLVGSLYYDLSKRYSVNLAASYDFEENDVRHTNLLVGRRFERTLLNVGVYLDRIDNDGGIRLDIYPLGFDAVRLSGLPGTN